LLLYILLLSGCAAKQEEYDLEKLTSAEIAELIAEGKLEVTDELLNELDELGKPLTYHPNLIFTQGQLYREQTRPYRAALMDGWVPYGETAREVVKYGPTWPNLEGDAENIPAGSPLYEHPNRPDQIVVYDTRAQCYVLYTLYQP
jgi:hypothetical protein